MVFFVIFDSDAQNHNDILEPVGIMNAGLLNLSQRSSTLWKMKM